MRKTIWDKRIPTLLGIFVIALSIGVTSYLVGQNTFFQGHASPVSTPQNIRITNISDTSVTISYITPGSVIGTLNFGKDTNLGQTITDDRDKDQIKEHKIHTFSINNLSPSTRYFFAILSGQESFLNSGAPYQLTTGPALKALGNAGFIVGKVVTPDGKNPNEAEVFAISDGAAPLSTNVKSDGTYTISLETLRKDDLSSYLSLKSSSIIKLLVVSDSGSSSVQIQVKGINNVPVIVLSQDYDFAQDESNPTPNPSPSENFPKISQGKSGDSPKILTPTDNQGFSNQTPTFKGKGIPNDKVKIIIQSNEAIQTDVTVDSSGNWSFQPTTNLSPGQHTITITAKDALGILKTISKTFTVTSAEAALAPTPTPTSTPIPLGSPAPSSTPTATPTLSPLPTPVASSLPSPTPISLVTPLPTPSSVLLPATGSNDIPTGILGISAAVAGGIFLLISKLLL